MEMSAGKIFVARIGKTRNYGRMLIAAHREHFDRYICLLHLQWRLVAVGLLFTERIRLVVVFLTSSGYFHISGTFR